MTPDYTRTKLALADLDALIKSISQCPKCRDRDVTIDIGPQCKAIIKAYALDTQQEEREIMGEMSIGSIRDSVESPHKHRLHLISELGIIPPPPS